MPTATFFRRLLPVVLLTSLALASCEHCKDHDPRPRGKCGNSSPTTTTTTSSASGSHL